VNNLDIDNELAAIVVDNEDTNAAVALVEGSRQTGVKPGLVDDRQAGLDITRLSHGGDTAVLDVKNAVLLENRPEHGLNNDTGGRVGDKGRLLMQLLAEQIHTEIAVLTGGGRG